MTTTSEKRSASQLPFGWVCFSNSDCTVRLADESAESQLPFGWVCFSNRFAGRRLGKEKTKVSIAFRLGLFL